MSEYNDNFIIDGHRGYAHITSDKIADANMATTGFNEYVMNIGNALNATVESNNNIKILDGLWMIQGRRGIIEYGDVVNIPIDNGVQGANRNDIICIRFEKTTINEGTEDEDVIESMRFYVAKGTPNEGDPKIQDSTIIRGGALVHDMPLYRVKIEGINIVALEQLWKYAQSSDLMVGDIIPTARNTPSAGFLICDGASISVDAYKRLYDVIGFTFTPQSEQGSGYFRLPDMRGNVPVGMDSRNSKFNAIGKKYGNETVSLTADQNGEHIHRYAAAIAGVNVAGGSTSLYSASNAQPWTESSGKGSPHNNIQPSIALNWQIKYNPEIMNGEDPVSILEELDEIRRLVAQFVPTEFDLVLPSSDWSNKKQTLNVSGMTTDAKGTLGLKMGATDQQASAYWEAGILIESQTNGQIVVRCVYNVPNVDIPVVLSILGGQ